MAKKPARALPADPARKRSPRYIGLYVVWWDDGNWEWLKCVNCGQELTSPESRERGFGPDCAAVVTDGGIAGILRDEHANAEAYLEEKKRPRLRHHRPAKRTSLDTSGFTTMRLPDAPRSPGKRSTKRPRGITNPQARELARLQRAAGTPYTGAGMTEHEARAEIRRLKR